MEHIGKEQQRADNTKSASTELQGLSFPSRMLVHAKLEMSSPGDADETEADALASEVMKGGVIKRRISGGGTSSGIAMPSRMSGFLSSTLGGGSSLPSGIRSKMETGFGLDFSNVRVHDNPAAAEASRSIGAQAFTYGNDIYFNHGKFSPGTEDGQKLIAHELAHVAQGNQYVHRQPDNSADTLQYSFNEDKHITGEYVEDYSIEEGSPLYKALTNPFAKDIPDLSRGAKHNLDKVSALIDNYLPVFKAFANGDTIRACGTEKQVEIPDIHPLLNRANELLREIDPTTPDRTEVMAYEYTPNTKQKTGKRQSKAVSYRSTMLNTKGERLDATHPRVVSYLRNLVGAEKLNYLWLWIRFCHIDGPQALLKAIGFDLDTKKSHIKHTYTLNTLSSFDIGKGLSLAAGAGYENVRYRFSYQNTGGMYWSMDASRRGFILSAGFSYGVPGSLKENNGTCVSKVENSDLWITPYDLIHKSSSGSLEIGAKVASGIGASVGKSFLTFDVKDKGQLAFDTSGLCLSTGTQATVGASISVNLAPGGLDSPTELASDFKPDLSFSKQSYTKDIKLYVVDSAPLFFETGSSEVLSPTYGSHNERTLYKLLSRLKDGIISSRDAGMFEGVDIKIKGQASPMWKYKKNGQSKNLELSERRAEAAGLMLRDKFNEEDFRNTLGVDYLKFSSNTSDRFAAGVNTISISGVGDYENRVLTNSNSNEEAFRSAMIVISVKVSKLTGDLTPSSPSETE